MLRNPSVYPTSEPSLDDIDSAIGALAQAETETSNGGTDHTPARNARLYELTDLTNRPVDYVQLKSGGNFENISQAGSWQVLAIQGKLGYETIGLGSGKNYRFRVAAQNNAGLGPYSDEAQSVAR